MNEINLVGCLVRGTIDVFLKQRSLDQKVPTNLKNISLRLAAQTTT